MKLRMADPDMETASPTRQGPRHQWEATERSLESAIRKATVPKYDAAYVQTFTDPTVTIPVTVRSICRYKLSRASRLGLAPESSYPRCDLCGRPGDVQPYGRWAFHRACWMRAQREAPSTTALQPFTAYTIRRPHAKTLR